jgi:Family of unknown function (DUF6159)
MPEGKMERGWRLTRESWSVVRLRPALLVVPALSALATGAAAVLLLGPWSLDILAHHSRERIFVDAAVCAYPFTAISTFFNVAFTALAAAALDGRSASLGEAFGRARSRLGPIMLWALISTVVGIALRALEQVPFSGGLIGRVAEFVAGLAWSLAAFFVVPVLALEDVSAPASLRRSAQTIRHTWGESVTGAVVVGAAFGVVAGLAGVAAAIGAIAGHAGFGPGYAVAAFGAVVLIVCVVLQTAVAGVFRLAVYHHATESGATGPYAHSDLETAFRPRTRRFWR